MVNGKKEFVRITNQQVYDQLCELRKSNEIEHDKIMALIEGYKSQVSNLKYAIGGIGILTISILGWFIYHLGSV